MIDIPQGLKDDFEYERWTALTCAMMKDALEEGTVLPKGHGRLIDADDVEECKEIMNTIMGESKYAVRMDNIRNVPTIIEADKAGDEE